MTTTTDFRVRHRGKCMFGEIVASEPLMLGSQEKQARICMHDKHLSRTVDVIRNEIALYAGVNTGSAKQE